MVMNHVIPLCGLLAPIVLCGGVAAAQLDRPACAQLRQDIAAIEKSGARANLAKGAAWAKANLEATALEQVERLIDAEQQFQFRCPQPKRQYDAATEQLMEHGTGSDPDPDAAKAAKTDPANPAAATAPAKKAAPRPKPKPAAADAATPAPANAAPAAVAKPKRAVAAKPKPDDAYVATPKSGDAGAQ